MWVDGGTGVRSQELQEFRIRTAGPTLGNHSATPELLQLLTPGFATPEFAPPSICVMLQESRKWIRSRRFSISRYQDWKHGLPHARSLLIALNRFFNGFIRREFPDFTRCRTYPNDCAMSSAASFSWSRWLACGRRAHAIRRRNFSLPS